MNYYNKIKNELINNEIDRKVKTYSINKSDLDTYYNVGKMLIEAQGGELKVTELKKEHIGQIEVYMNYIDNSIKTIEENKTIGIIICKHDNKFIMEYCSDSRILSKEYKLV